MAFESIRKFVSVKKGRNRSNALLSLNVVSGTDPRNGEARYAISILVNHELIAHVGWNEKTRVDILVDSENQMCMLKPDSSGFALSFPNKNKDGGYEGVSAYIKFKLPEPFEYIPKESDRIELTIIECNDFIVFEMPKVKIESNDQKKEVRSSFAVSGNRIDRPFSLGH